MCARVQVTNLAGDAPDTYVRVLVGDGEDSDSTFKARTRTVFCNQKPLFEET